MLTIPQAAAFAEAMRLRPGYEIEVEPSGLVYVSCEGPNAFRPGTGRWFWSFRLDLPDLDSERTLLRRLILGLVELDFHEHLEFSRRVNPHKDLAEVAIVSWPLELR